MGAPATRGLFSQQPSSFDNHPAERVASIFPVLSAARANKVQEQFGNAMGADDFMQRVEMALYAFGFNGDNSIGAYLREWSVQAGGRGLQIFEQHCTVHALGLATNLATT